MLAITMGELEFSDAFIEADETARWRSAAGHSPSTGSRASGSSVIEIPAGCRLPPHTDSAEETIVVVAGTAEVQLAGDRAELSGGGIAVVPQDAVHATRERDCCGSSRSMPHRTS
jgi:quercetin dioxygenase-like cupin family protein